MYDGLAFAGLYIRKEYDGPGTQKRSYSNKDILVHPGLCIEKEAEQGFQFCQK